MPSYCEIHGCFHVQLWFGRRQRWACPCCHPERTPVMRETSDGAFIIHRASLAVEGW